MAVTDAWDILIYWCYTVCKDRDIPQYYAKTEAIDSTFEMPRRNSTKEVKQTSNLNNFSK